MAALPQVLEVDTLVMHPGEEGDIDRDVNKKLASGNWILLQVRITEWQRWFRADGFGNAAHLRQDSRVIYVLGRIK